jgi:hypothetical protein
MGLILLFKKKLKATRQPGQEILTAATERSGDSQSGKIFRSKLATPAE